MPRRHRPRPPADPFNRTALLLDREGRVAAVAAVFEALATGRPVPPAAGRFVGSVGLSWLSGRDANKSNRLDHALGIVGPERSRRSPQFIYRALLSGATDAPAEPTQEDRGNPEGVAQYDDDTAREPRP